MSESRLKILLVVIVIFNIADYMLTLRCLEGGLVEGNPLMAPVVGTPWFFFIKVVLIPVLLYGVWRVRDQIGAAGRTAILLAVGVYAALMVGYGVLFAMGYVA